MKALNVSQSLRKSPVLRISASTTAEQADAAFPKLGEFNTGGVFVGRYQGTPPWERHEQDELLHVIAGGVEVTLIEGRKKSRVRLKRGEFFVVPKGLWHRPVARKLATLLSVTPQPTQVSFTTPVA